MVLDGGRQSVVTPLQRVAFGHGGAMRVVVALAAVSGLAGCVAHAVKPHGPVAKPETSYKLISPPGAPQYALKPGQSASLPAPLIGYFAPPVYPPSLARRGMPLVVVTAHLVFDANGKVEAVAIVSDSYAAAGHALFEAAVRKAAGEWVFTPLVFAETTGGDGRPLTLKREAKPFSLWFEFRFVMVDGKPAVETVKH